MPNDLEPFSTPCPTCQGTGKDPKGDPCPTCLGVGQVLTEKGRELKDFVRKWA